MERRARAIGDVVGVRWVEFWADHVDLEALGWEAAELLADLAAAEDRVARAGEEARRHWARLYGDDPLLLSVPGMGPRTAPTVRAFSGRPAFRDGQAGAGLRRAQPVELVERPDELAVTSDHQGGSSGAAAGLLPGGQRGAHP